MDPLEGTMPETPSSDVISTRCQRIAELARRHPGEPLTTLAHHIDVDWLRVAYERTRKDGAPGVDGRTGAAYAVNLEANLRSLLQRAKSGAYRAPAVRRTYIPKGDGSERRALGIPTFEDKVLQRAVAMVLEAVYEHEFLDCSYGFRPGRSAHQALAVARESLMAMGGGWIIDLDVRKFFDRVDHRLLREVLRQRVRDGVVVRLIGKWLNAGVMEQGQWHRAEQGTPQGGVIPPLLANVFLHEVLDVWFEQVVKPRLRGEAHLIRYADDAVVVFRREDDARRVMAVLPRRFAKYGLELHPQKTRMVAFRRPAPGPMQPGDRPDTFDLLGFTHYWARSKRGHWVIKRKTTRDRLRRTITAIDRWCRRCRHLPVDEQWVILNRKLQGHYAYFGLTGNSAALARVRHWTMWSWHRWLSRRSQKGTIRWDAFYRFLERYPLARPRLRPA